MCPWNGLDAIMGNAQPTMKGMSRLRSPLLAIPIIGMIWIELVYLSFTAFFLATTGGVPFFVFFWSPFMILLPISIVLVLKKPRVGYILATVIAALGLVSFSDGGHGVEI